ncbi:MAG: c-type cytochrome [Natronohydrobacter sp.]|nr:c-type cytochrome [Natronohydrobacter sp.]
MSATLGAVFLGLSSFAAHAGDVEAGASAFQSQCQNCHNVTDADGEVLAGRPNVRTGPNLYGVIGRQAGTYDGFRYGASLVEAGEAGLVWDEAEMVPYLLDPNTYLREKLGSNRARSQMSFRVRDEATANDIIAFLAQFGAVEEADEEEASGS